MVPDMARILCISSQVTRGHVGISVIVPALQALGHEVIALPTILLSNHPGHAHVAGERIAPDLLRRMRDALDANGWLSEVDAVITGYLPSVDHVAFAAEAIAQLRAVRRDLVFLCDPVIGDEPKGVYIAEDAARAIRDSLLPHADVIRLNRFELGWIAGEDVTSVEDAQRVVQEKALAHVIVTSIPVPGSASIENALLIDGAVADRSRVVRHERVPNGTGDLLSALIIGHHIWAGHDPVLAFRAAIDGVRRVVEVSRGASELHLVDCLPAFAATRS